MGATAPVFIIIIRGNFSLGKNIFSDFCLTSNILKEKYSCTQTSLSAFNAYTENKNNKFINNMIPKKSVLRMFLCPHCTWERGINEGES